MPIFEYVCGECNHRFELLVYGSTPASLSKVQHHEVGEANLIVRSWRDGWLGPARQWGRRLRKLR